MVLAAPGLLLTPPASSSPPKTPFRSYSAQIRSQNEEKNPPPGKPYQPLHERTQDPAGHAACGGTGQDRSDNAAGPQAAVAQRRCPNPSSLSLLLLQTGPPRVACSVACVRRQRAASPRRRRHAPTVPRPILPRSPPPSPPQIGICRTSVATGRRSFRPPLGAPETGVNCGPNLQCPPTSSACRRPPPPTRNLRPAPRRQRCQTPAIPNSRPSPRRPACVTQRRATIEISATA